jgi:hypothetical protein
MKDKAQADIDNVTKRAKEIKILEDDYKKAEAK